MLGLGAPGTARAQSERPYEQLIYSYTDWDAAKAYRVMWCESKADPRAYSGGNVGLFQIAYEWHTSRVPSLEALYDPETNVRVAHEIWTASGWQPWGCRGA